MTRADVELLAAKDALVVKYGSTLLAWSAVAWWAAVEEYRRELSLMCDEDFNMMIRSHYQ